MLKCIYHKCISIHQHTTHIHIHRYDINATRQNWFIQNPTIPIGISWIYRPHDNPTSHYTPKRNESSHTPTGNEHRITPRRETNIVYPNGQLTSHYTPKRNESCIGNQFTQCIHLPSRPPNNIH